MPIYEYVCTTCDHRTDILHGINDAGPHYCPSCGREGTMRKLFAPPVIHYKGSGWAKKDRGASSARGTSGSSSQTPSSAGSDGAKPSGGAGEGSGSSGGAGEGSGSSGASGSSGSGSSSGQKD